MPYSFKNIVAVLFLLLFATPQVATSLHALWHEHGETCFDTKAHIHEKHQGCDFQDYLLFAADEPKLSAGCGLVLLWPSKPLVSTSEFVSDQNTLAFYLRGPPSQMI